MTVSFDTAAFEADLTALVRDIEVKGLAAFRTTVNDAAAASTQYGYHDRTGRLTRERRTLVSGTPSGWQGQVVWVTPYALFVDKPTKGHPIVARRGGYLRFYDKSGNVVFRKRVWHPGTMGSNFSMRAEDFFRNVCSERLGASVDSAIQAHP